MLPAQGDSPFLMSSPDSVHLANAPLVRVLCQVRWPALTRFIQSFDTFGDAIGSELAEEYPLFAKRQEAQFVIGPDGVVAEPGIFVYQWSSSDSVWVIHFAPTFLTMETSRYSSKEDLLSRFRRVVDVVGKVVSIPTYTRIGYRYTNRVTGVTDINELIRPEVRGGGAVPLEGVDASVIQSVTETLYRVEADMLLARWAQLPSGTTIDPAIPPIQADSWVLDLDTFSETPTNGFDPESIASTAHRLALRGSTFFRWSVTDQFLERFGARR